MSCCGKAHVIPGRAWCQDCCTFQQFFLYQLTNQKRLPSYKKGQLVACVHFFTHLPTNQLLYFSISLSTVSFRFIFFAILPSNLYISVSASSIFYRKFWITRVVFKMIPKTRQHAWNSKTGELVLYGYWIEVDSKYYKSFFDQVNAFVKTAYSSPSIVQRGKMSLTTVEHALLFQCMLPHTTPVLPEIFQESA